ncbi:MAG: sigma-70 family RNA polymerase sigma factor [Agathobacter sp.]|nr:sigma-70 family RNA polymerase sigma factor [Agathobacter sp.]
MECANLPKDEGWKNDIRKAQCGDKESKDKVFEENQGLLYMAAKRFTGRGYEINELVQIGAVGLLKAIERFNVESDYSFSTYAVPVIIGEIQRFLRDDSMIHISRSIKDNARIIASVKEKYNINEGEELSIGRLEELTGLKREEIIMSLDAYKGVESIYKPMGEDMLLYDKIEDKRNPQNELISRLTVDKLLEELDEKQSALIRYRYMDNLTQMQTAEKMGMNQVAVSRLEKKILREMYCKLV